MNDDTVVIWEAPKIEPPEFRLYYDDNGNVLTYTCAKLPGNYIVIDKQTYAESRNDIKVIDGKISKIQNNTLVYKLMPDEKGNTICYKNDVSIIVDKDFKGDTRTWKLISYEL